MTARKLGALFESVLPKTTRLVEAYGLRCSEIAEHSVSASNPSQYHGIFSEQAGVDATSIWAAATSGNAAIAVHLLACMLARMWSGAEATSIWAEIIEERKNELSGVDVGSIQFPSSFLASQICVSRDQLAEWDNSARAWLRVADESKAKQQTQLMLIVKNLNIPVNDGKGSLYQSVMSAWQRALELMEGLLCQKSQSITPYCANGDLLLALTSWHIYPDLDVSIVRLCCQFKLKANFFTAGLRFSSSCSKGSSSSLRVRPDHWTGMHPCSTGYWNLLDTSIISIPFLRSS
jgi:hypothetical protein